MPPRIPERKSLVSPAELKRVDQITKAVEDIDARREQVKKDACFITEIIRDLKPWGIHRTEKCMTMLLNWQKELMEKAGFNTMDELKDYFFKHVGEENW